MQCNAATQRMYRLDSTKRNRLWRLSLVSAAKENGGMYLEAVLAKPGKKVRRVTHLLCSHGLLSILHTRDRDVRQIDDGKMDFNCSICCLVCPPLYGLASPLLQPQVQDAVACRRIIYEHLRVSDSAPQLDWFASVA